MINEISLKEIERKAYRSFFQDGLWDISWGIWLFVWALVPVLESKGFSKYWGYPVFFFSPLIIALGKKYITIPRLGLVKFNRERQVKREKLFIIIALMVLLCVVLLGISSKYVLDLKGGLMVLDIIMGLMIGTFLSVTAFFMEYNRLYLYAIIVGIGLPGIKIIRQYVGNPTDHILMFGIPSVIIMAFGLIMLVRFIVKYPITSEEISHE
jgi:hypothetical protein